MHGLREKRAKPLTLQGMELAGKMCYLKLWLVPHGPRTFKGEARMFKLIVAAIAAMLSHSAANAAPAEFALTCAWDLGGKFVLKISEQAVTKNGRAVSEKVSISETQISWHEISPSGSDYEYSIDRSNGVLVASTFNKSYNRKVENKAICVKAGAGSEPGF
jgi:hypothetical protein